VSFLLFDVESVGLHGEGFAVAWELLSADLQVVESGYFGAPAERAAGIDSDRAWIAEHVLPHLPPPPQREPREVRDLFWKTWLRAKANGARLVADCAWPVETRFLSACVDDDPLRRAWEGPHPLLDVAVVRLGAGLEPLMKEPRLPHELPEHDPRADVVFSRRRLAQALGR
jgi:hypothetical protein